MITTFSDGASQLLNVPPAKGFNESISQNQREESVSQIVSGIYDHTSSTTLSKTRTEILTSEIWVHRPWGISGDTEGRSLSRRLLLHHATLSLAPSSVRGGSPALSANGVHCGPKMFDSDRGPRSESSDVIQVRPLSESVHHSASAHQSAGTARLRADRPTRRLL